jgi:hypothetical protein
MISFVELLELVMNTKIVACFGWKYESEEMVNDLKENISWVDDFCVLDCRDRKELWIHEGDYRLTLREMARDKGADWILITSPDERWEKDAGVKIREQINNKDKKILEFNLKELYHPMWYRVGENWDKLRMRCYPLYDDQVMAYQSIQCPPIPQNEYEVVHVDVNIYHTKMIELENRKTRVRVFNYLDPDKKFQPDYDYLDNETGARMVRIQEDRMYYPKYKKYIFNIPEEYYDRGDDVCLERKQNDNSSDQTI